MVAKARWSNDRLQQAVTLYESGHTLAEVCQLLKTGLAVLKRHLRQAGVDIRTQGHWKRLTKEQEAAIVQLYQDGNSVNKTASLVGVSHTAIHTYLQANNLIGLRPRKLPRSKINQIVQTYQAGHDLSECAHLLGHSIGTIARYVRAAGIDVRPQPRDGADNPCWRGGRTEHRGYIYVYCPDHPHAVGSYVREHRLVMERHLGRHLTSEEVVHHKNKNTRDNRIENLQLFSTNGEHLAHELKGQVPKWTEEGKRRLHAARSKRSPQPSRNSDRPTACGEQLLLFPDQT